MKTKASSGKGGRQLRVQRVVSGRGYAWMCGFGLCHWAKPDKKRLVASGPPSPEACAVPVRIITEKDYRKLIAR